jgi:hypothetical protein
MSSQYAMSSICSIPSRGFMLASALTPVKDLNPLNSMKAGHLGCPGRMTSFWNRIIVSIGFLIKFEKMEKFQAFSRKAADP